MIYISSVHKLELSRTILTYRPELYGRDSTLESRCLETCSLVDVLVLPTLCHSSLVLWFISWLFQNCLQAKVVFCLEQNRKWILQLIFSPSCLVVLSRVWDLWYPGSSRALVCLWLIFHGMTLRSSCTSLSIISSDAMLSFFFLSQLTFSSFHLLVYALTIVCSINLKKRWCAQASALNIGEWQVYAEFLI